MEVRVISLFLCLIAGALCENFLILHPVYVGSHEFTMRNLGEILVRRGHSVTQVVFKREGVEYPRSTVDLIQITADMKNGSVQAHNFNEFGEVAMDVEILWSTPRRFWGVPLSIVEMNGIQCETLLGDPLLFSMLQSRNFTAVILDVFTNSCGVLFSSLFKLPTIGFLQIGAVGMDGRYLGAVNPPSVSSQIMSDSGVPRTFLQRAWNFFCAAFDWATHNYIQTRGAQAIMQKYYQEVPDVYEILGNLDLVLSGSHPIVEFPKYMTQKMISIGCFHCRPANRIQDKALREFLDSSEHPVILVSFGYTMANSGGSQKKLLRVLMEAFRKLPVRAVIAFDPAAEDPEMVPDNVMLLRWLPQQDVLGHPKTAIFLSHCGISSVLEGVYHAAKFIAVPINLDQGENALRLQDLGVLKHIIDHNNVKPADVVEAVKKTLDDYSLRRNAKRYSNMLRDSLIGVEDNAVRAIEQAVKYGAKHMNIPSYKLNILQFYCLDVVLFFALILAVYCWLLVFVSRRLYHWWRKLPKEEVKEKSH